MCNAELVKEPYFPIIISKEKGKYDWVAGPEDLPQGVPFTIVHLNAPVWLSSILEKVYVEGYKARHLEEISKRNCESV